MSATEWTGELSPIESRAEIDSLEDLHQRRRQILPEYANLKARHGAFGKYDFLRKAMLEACKIRARMDAQQKQEKVTESYIDSLGHADPQYVAFIDEGIAQAVRFVELETEMSEITERIENRSASMYFVGQEMKLQR